VHLVRVVADDGDRGAGGGEPARGEPGLAEDRGADDEQCVVGRERLAEPGPVGGEHTLIRRVVLRKPGAGAERLLEDGRAQLLDELHERRPRIGVVGAGAHDERRPTGARKERGERVDGHRVGRGRSQHGAARGRGLAVLVRRLEPVAHRNDHERRAASRGGRVVGALDRSGHVLRGGRGLDRDRVLARQAVQPAGEERLVGEVAPVLLADDDDERRPVHPSGREPADTGAEPGRRVQQGECGLVSADRVPARHSHNGALVQAEHEAEVLRQPREERHLGGAGVREHRRQPASAEEVEGRVADEPGHGRVYHGA
jgi:hypothetical protein